ncbi:MAG: LysR family transcriptional regulator substrate-binding protein, partial [Proteobacteria bacterium]|nr:LysR family transcriptional regulator substrate-binding protein [Pseudomonadota bacterium]
PQPTLVPCHWVIQGPSSSMRTRVLPLLRGFLTRFPPVSLGLHIADLESGVERLKSGSTDLLIAERGQIGKEFDSKILKPERYILVAPVKWKNRSIDSIISSERIIDFDPSDVMTHLFLQKYGLRGKARTDRHFVNSTECIADLLVAGLGYSVLSEEYSEAFIKKGLLCNLFPDKFLDYKLALAWYPRKQMPNSFRDLVKSIH